MKSTPGQPTLFDTIPRPKSIAFNKNTFAIFFVKKQIVDLPVRFLFKKS